MAAVFGRICYTHGQGVPQSFDKAAVFFRRAAKKGHAGAQFMLGNMAMIGNGFPYPDVREARKWFVLAAAQGNQQAKEQVAECDLEIAKSEKLTQKFPAGIQDQLKRRGNMFTYTAPGHEDSAEETADLFQRFVYGKK
jgi:TPR repeat protein